MFFVSFFVVLFLLFIIERLLAGFLAPPVLTVDILLRFAAMLPVSRLVRLDRLSLCFLTLRRIFVPLLVSLNPFLSIGRIAVLRITADSTALVPFATFRRWFRRRVVRRRVVRRRWFRRRVVRRRVVRRRWFRRRVARRLFFSYYFSHLVQYEFHGSSARFGPITAPSSRIARHSFPVP